MRSPQDHSLVIVSETMGIMRIQAPLPTPLFSDNDDSRAFLLARPSPEDFRVLITDSGLLSSFMRLLRKPSFFFGDSLTPDDELLVVGTEQWIYEVDGDRFFLPPIQRSHSLGYLHRLPMQHHMEWELARRIH